MAEVSSHFLNGSSSTVFKSRQKTIISKVGKLYRQKTRAKQPFFRPSILCYQQLTFKNGITEINKREKRGKNIKDKRQMNIYFFT